MPKTAAAKRTDRFSDDAVSAKTGKNWQEWFKLLDAAKAHTMNHTAIAALLRNKHGCPTWWNQMVAVQYERERGLREKHQKPDGYSISASKTMAAEAGDIFGCWLYPPLLRRWLRKVNLKFGKVTVSKSIRSTTENGKTNLDVMFYPKSHKKCQVSVQHSKLKNRAEAMRMKKYWSEALERLKRLVESNVLERLKRSVGRS